MDFKNPSAHQILSEEDMKELGQRLEVLGLGFYVSQNESSTEMGNLVYSQLPTKPELVHVCEGVIIPGAPRLFAAFCRTACNVVGHEHIFIAKSKEGARMHAKCIRSGIPCTPRGAGKRSRISQKTNCPARVLTKTVTNSMLIHQIEKKMGSLSPAKQDDVAFQCGNVQDLLSENKVVPDGKIKRWEHNGWAEISTNDMFNHNCCSSCVESRDKTVMGENEKAREVDFIDISDKIGNAVPRNREFTLVADLLRYPKIRSLIESFVRIRRKRGRGFFHSLAVYLRDNIPEIIFDANNEVLKRAVEFIDSSKDQIKSFVNKLSALRKTGDIEYLQVNLNQEGILQKAIWAYKGSKELLARCGKDICFMDTTHNTTSYHYKLCTITVIDSESVSRSVLLCLTLHETEEDFRCILGCYRSLAGGYVPNVIFTDGDEAMAIAISQEAEESKHLLCQFHLFDRNVKDRLQPCLKVVGSDIDRKVKRKGQEIDGNTAWLLFRKGLSIVREAPSEEKCTELFFALLEEYLPQNLEDRNGRNEIIRRARKYMLEYIWPKRKSWATCFFDEEFTMGASTTQRAESWHATLKAVSSSTDVIDLVKVTHRLVHRQGRQELKSSNTAFRISPLASSAMASCKENGVQEFATKFGLGRYACTKLAESLRAAELLRCDFSYIEGTKTFAASFSSLFNGAQDKRILAEATFFLSCKRIDDACSSGYGYVSDSSESEAQHSSFENDPCSCQLHAGLNDNESGRDLLTCTCKYYARTRLPCEHLLSLAISIDRETATLREGKETSPTFYGCLRKWRSTLQCIIAASFATDINSSGRNRWMSKKHCRKLPEIIFKSLPSTKETDPDDCNSTPLDADSSTFMDRRIAFGRVMSHCKIVAERFSDNCHVPDSKKILILLQTALKNIASVIEDGDITTVEKINTFREVNKVFQTIENHENWDASPPKTPSSFKGGVNEYGDDSTIQDLETSQNIQSPPRRAARSNNLASGKHFKNREVRKKQVQKSQKRPLNMRSEKGDQTIPKLPRSSGFSCPFCTQIKPQNNAQNVRQHVQQKHPEEDISKLSLNLMLRDSEENNANITNINKRKLEIADESKNIERKSKMPRTSKNRGKHLDNEDQKPEQASSCDSGNKSPNLISVSSVETIPERENIPFHTEVYPRRVCVNKNAATPNDLSEVHLGSVLRILWKNDLQWFAGEVLKKNGSTVQLRYSVDDTSEHLDLSLERWVLSGEQTGVEPCSTKLSEETSIRAAKIIDHAGELSAASKIIEQGSFSVYSEDIQCLRNGSWLDDRIILSYLKATISVSHHLQRERVLVLDSLIPASVSRQKKRVERRKMLERQFQNLPLHAIDIILLPYHYNGNHWMLVYGNVSTKKVVGFDPFAPMKRQTHLENYIVNLFNDMWHSYNLHMKSSTECWTFGSVSINKELIRKFNLPKQPEWNSCDCGIIVCIYAHCIGTGLPFHVCGKFPASIASRDNISQETWGRFSEVMRRKIAVTVMDHANKMSIDQ